MSLSRIDRQNESERLVRIPTGSSDAIAFCRRQLAQWDALSGLEQVLLMLSAAAREKAPWLGREGPRISFERGPHGVHMHASAVGGEGDGDVELVPSLAVDASVGEIYRVAFELGDRIAPFVVRFEGYRVTLRCLRSSSEPAIDPSDLAALLNAPTPRLVIPALVDEPSLARTTESHDAGSPRD